LKSNLFFYKARPDSSISFHQKPGAEVALHRAAPKGAFISDTYGMPEGMP
jgi:hypothetical protein